MWFNVYVSLVNLSIDTYCSWKFTIFSLFFFYVNTIVEPSIHSSVVKTHRLHRPFWRDVVDWWRRKVWGKGIWRCRTSLLRAWKIWRDVGGIEKRRIEIEANNSAGRCPGRVRYWMLARSLSPPCTTPHAWRRLHDCLINFTSLDSWLRTARLPPSLTHTHHRDSGCPPTCNRYGNW